MQMLVPSALGALALASACGAHGEDGNARAQVVTLPPPSIAPAASSAHPVESVAAAEIADAGASTPPAIVVDPDTPSAWGSHVWSAAHDAGARHVPTLHTGNATVSAGLPPEVIQRIVRQNYGRFRLCYENGLRKDPKLQGRIVVEIEIDTSGAVTGSNAIAGTTLADRDVVRCVVRGFVNLSFPQPTSGSVIVDYPIDFAP